MTTLRTLWPVGVVAGFIAGLTFWLPERHHSFLTGAYRYPATAESLPNSSIETAFVSWVDPEAPAHVERLLDLAQRRQRIAMLNLEPFADPQQTDSHRTLTDDIVRGKYKPQLRAILQSLCKAEQPVLLRFAHEMDHTDQYPWSVERGNDYIKLYRTVWSEAQHFPCRRIHWVWSPSGNGDSRPFWPGSDVVDLIGVSVYTSPRWHSSGHLRSFAEIYEERRWLHRHFRKPVLVAEMGVSGTSSQQRRWLESARSAISRYPELIGWVYFSAPQPKWIPLPTGHEDWSLASAELKLVSSPQRSNAIHCRFFRAISQPLYQTICPLRPLGSI